MHRDLKESGLGGILEIKTVTADEKLMPFLGKKVRYKRELLTEKFIERNGLKVVDGTFEVREVQKNYKGENCLRLYWLEVNDTFGFPESPDRIEIV